MIAAFGDGIVSNVQIVSHMDGRGAVIPFQELINEFFTIEPGIYITNETKGGGEIFGIRIENDYGVVMSGGELLTHYTTDSEDMIVLPYDDYEEDEGEEDEGFVEEHSTVVLGLGILFLAAVPVIIFASKRFSEK